MLIFIIQIIFFSFFKFRIVWSIGHNGTSSPSALIQLADLLVSCRRKVDSCLKKSKFTGLKDNPYSFVRVSFVCFSLSSALMRERDELAAALEVRERIKYDLATPEREEVLSTGDLIIEVTMRLTIVYLFYSRQKSVSSFYTWISTVACLFLS